MSVFCVFSCKTNVLNNDIRLSYQGNQLSHITDNSYNNNGLEDSSDLKYDANGNMTQFPAKTIDNISYNHLNLPSNISSSFNTYYYLYNAAGQKLRKTKRAVFLHRTDNNDDINSLENMRN